IKIVTKTGAGRPPVTKRVDGGFGSFNHRTGARPWLFNKGPWSSSLNGTLFASDGYRANNALNRINGVGDVRYTTPDFSAFLTVT
ncbi:UNVERIFIED_CONTAM: TonB-dependent receptor, partial [Bacteroidetes bacterium 56_B9]